MSRILHIATAIPGNRHAQRSVADFYSRALNGNDPQGKIARQISAVAAKSGIKQRYSVIADFSGPDRDLFPEAHEKPAPPLTVRMELFADAALPLAVQSAQNIPEFESLKSRITHIITVTCTGLSAPGLELEMIQRLELPRTTQRYAVNFMGCNAGLLALRQASDICRANTRAVVLVTAVELCSIHFQYDYSEDYLLSNLLFGDGAASVIVAGDTSGLSGDGLHFIRFDSLIIPEGKDKMGWRLSEAGFIMKLSSDVPEYVARGLKSLVDNAGILPGQVSVWAMHPGGKRILEAIRRAFNLSEDDIALSAKVLSDYGNLSSATIFFVLREALLLKKAPGEEVFAAAFGPGLTIESCVLSYV